jgi:hypothetical protein
MISRGEAGRHGSGRTLLAASLHLFVVALSFTLTACGREARWTRLDVAELRRDPLLRLPNEPIVTLASAPDGAVFVSTFQGNVYRRMPGGGAWTRIGTAPNSIGRPAQLTIHPFSARAFVATEFSRIYRWREGEPIREEKTVFSDSLVGCGDFSSFIWLRAVWGTEDDTYVAADHGNVLHYRGGRWTLERTPLTDVQPDPCVESFASDLMAIGGADGWVYAAGRRIVRSRGDGRWQEVRGPARGDTTAAIGAIASQDGGMLFAAALWRGHDVAEPTGRAAMRFYRPGQEGEWTEVTRAPPPARYASVVQAHERGPAVFFSWGGTWMTVVDGRRVRAWWPKDGHTDLRGGVPVGRDVWIAVNDSVTGLVVRLPR